MDFSILGVYEIILIRTFNGLIIVKSQKSTLKIELNIHKDIYYRHVWRTAFVANIRGGLAPATVLAYPSWEEDVVQGTLQQYSDEAKEKKEKLKIQITTPYVHYLILVTLILAIASFIVIHTIQMIFVQLSAQIDVTIPPVTIQYAPSNLNGTNQGINGTGHGLSLEVLLHVFSRYIMLIFKYTR